MDLYFKSKYSGLLNKLFFSGFLLVLVIPTTRAENPFLHSVVYEEPGKVYQYQVVFGDVDRKTNTLVEYYWHLNGKLRSTYGDYSGNLLHGEFNEFDKSNRLLCKGSFYLGVKNGNWKYWNPNGEINGWEKWRKGLLIQKIKITQTQKITENYRRNKLHGKRIIYQENENELIEKYKNGTLTTKKSRKLFDQIFKFPTKNDSLKI